MSEIPESLRFLLFGFGPEMAARMALAANSIGLVTKILGIIVGATGHKLGLGATNWFLLTIALFLFGAVDNGWQRILEQSDEGNSCF